MILEATHPLTKHLNIFQCEHLNPDTLLSTNKVLINRFQSINPLCNCTYKSDYCWTIEASNALMRYPFNKHVNFIVNFSFYYIKARDEPNF